MFDDRLADLARRAPMPVLGIDREGRLTYVNDSLCALTGYDREEILGSEFWSFIEGSDAERRRERFLRLRDEGIDTRFDAGIRTHDGHELRIAWHNVTSFDDSGHLEAVFSIGTDITDLRKAENRLERLNNTLQALSGIAGLALRVDDARELLDRACATLVDTGACVGAWIALVGDTGRPIGLVGSSMHNGTSPETPQAALRDLPDCVSQVLQRSPQIAINEISETCEACLFAPADPDVHGIATTISSGDEVRGVVVAHVRNSEPVGEETQRLFCSIADDLGFALAMLEARAMHDRTERSLAERTRMLDAFFESSIDPAAILDRDFNFVRVNQAYADSCDLTPGDLVGRNHFDLYQHEENELIFARVRDTGETYNVRAKPFEFPDHPEWGVTWWDWALVPTLDDKGHTVLLTLWLRDVTEQERTKQELEEQRDRLDEMVHERTAELQETNELLRAILHASPVAVVVHDADGNVALWNPAAEEISGWSAEEAIGGPPPLVPPDKREEFRANLARLADGGRIHAVPFERERRDGKRVRLELSAAPLHTADGEYAGSVVLFSDVTEREENARERERLMSMLEEYADHLEEMVAERTRELADSRDELRMQRDFVDAVIEEAGSLVVVVDARGTIVRFNRAAEEVSGWSADDVRGRNFLELLIPDDERDQVRNDFHGRLREGPGQYENWWRRKSGGRRRISWRLSVIRDEAGEMQFMIGSGWDVTDERRMARQLRESEGKYRELVENARTIIIRWDLDGTIRFMNEYGLELLGYTEDEVIGEHVNIIVPDVDSDGTDLTGLVDAIIASPEDYWTNANENVAKDGTRYWISWSNRLIRDDDGEVTAIMATGVDRTTERISQQELHSSREDLRELTAELAMAEQRERREVATVLHDNIGQLLAFTKMKISSLANQEHVGRAEFDQLQRYVEEIIAETRSITNQLAPPVLVQLDFVPALQWLTEDFAARHDLPVSFEADGTPDRLSDELSVTLFQATRELLTNAVKHANPGQVTVRLEVKDGNVCIGVEDDGAGFDVARLSDGRRPEGGFGLFNVQERISYLGGEIIIRSAPGEGTSITLVCPIVTRETTPS